MIFAEHNVGADPVVERLESGGERFHGRSLVRWATQAERPHAPAIRPVEPPAILSQGSPERSFRLIDRYRLTGCGSWSVVADPSSRRVCPSAAAAIAIRARPDDNVGRRPDPKGGGSIQPARPDLHVGHCVIGERYVPVQGLTAELMSAPSTIVDPETIPAPCTKNTEA